MNEVIIINFQMDGIETKIKISLAEAKKLQESLSTLLLNEVNLRCEEICEIKLQEPNETDQAFCEINKASWCL